MPFSTIDIASKLTILILIFLNNPTKQGSVVISADNFNQYFVKKGTPIKDNEDNDYFLNFTKGTWYKVDSPPQLEFHPYMSGMLDFNAKFVSFYSVNYLNAPDRVLIFPLQSKGERGRLPYVAESSTDLDSAEQIVYPKEEADVESIEKLNEAFAEIDLFAGGFEDQRMAIIKDWNHLPYFTPERYNMVKNSKYTNKWEIFIGMNDQIEDYITEQNMEALVSNRRFTERNALIEELLARIINFLFYDDVNFMFQGNLTPENEVRQMKNAWVVHELVGPLTLAEENSKLVERKLAKILKELNDKALSLVKPNILSIKPNLLTKVLEDLNGERLDVFMAKQKSRRLYFPRSEDSLSFNWELLSLAPEFENLHDFKSSISVEIQAFKEDMIELFKLIFPGIKNRFQHVSRQQMDTPKMKIFLENQARPEDLVMQLCQDASNIDESRMKLAFKEDQEDRYKEIFENLDFEQLYLDYLVSDFVSYVVDAYFTLVYKYIFNYSGVQDEIGLYLQNEWSDAEWFRILLMAFGNIEYNPVKYANKMSVDSAKIFSPTGDRLLI